LLFLNSTSFTIRHANPLENQFFRTKREFKDSTRKKFRTVPKQLNLLQKKDRFVTHRSFFFSLSRNPE